MSTKSETWGAYAAKVAVAGAVMMAAAFVGNRLAQAGPGEPVRDALTVSGVLRGVSGTATVAFRFYRAMGDTTPLCAPEVMVMPDATTGVFSVEVPLRLPGRECPGTLFHDPSVLVEVAVGGAVVAVRAPINPVPYAHYASQYGTPDCPVGYERATEAAFTGDMRLCVRRRTDGTPYDEVVRVGTGASAFWIDRYEASVWERADGTGAQYGAGGAPPYPGTFPPNGQATTSVYAVSLRGAIPTAYSTWFQANEACRASGKRLPRGEDWLAAGRGTSDPATDAEGASDTRCLTNARDLRRTGGHARAGDTVGCASDWGAEDMIGNVSEWTGDWYAGLGAADAGAGPRGTWPSGYRDDWTANIQSTSRFESAGSASLPGALIRGGMWNEGPRAGIFAMNLSESPAYSAGSIGFRCVIPR